MGIGGIGINAVQGAAHAGASNVIAVDPVAFKREKAQELGATHAFETIEEAAEIAKQLHQRPGRRQGDRHRRGHQAASTSAQAFAAIRKARHGRRHRRSATSPRSALPISIAS